MKTCWQLDHWNKEYFLNGFLSPQLDLQHRLKAAEEQMVSDNAASINSDDMESLENLKVELERKEKVLRATQEERDTLMSELEELDQQNQEATQVLLTSVLLTYVFRCIWNSHTFS